MGLFDRRPPRRTAMPVEAKFDVDDFVAAAVAVRSKEATVYRSQLPQWQRQALEFYDLVGEAWYPAQFYARMLSRVRLYPAIRKPNGEVEESKDAKAQEILQRIKDANGGSSQWKSQYGRLQFLIGDGYLAASLDADGNEQWEYLSPAELIVGDKVRGRRQYTRRMGNGVEDKILYEAAEGEELSKDTIHAWRMWRKHPTHSELADAPLRGVIGLLRVLMLLDKAAEAQAVSRIVGSGLLIVDDAITIPSADTDADDANAEDDPFMSLLTKFIVSPIGQPGSAAQMAPLVARVDTPEGKTVDDLIKLIQLHDPNQTADWHERIQKTITRIAIGLDMPPEEFLGLADANHWTGWVITEEKWKAHGEPVTIQLCDDLTSAYFRAACLAEEVPNAENMIVWYDPAQVVTHPDRGKDALAVHAAGALSDESLRTYNNFSNADAPSAEERAFYEKVKLKVPARPQDPSEEDAPGTGRDIAGDAPEDKNGKRTNQPSPQPGGQDMSTMQPVIRGAAAMAIERCRELAGSRLRAKRGTCVECFKDTENVPRAELAAVLGENVVRVVGITSELALVQGATDPFVKTAMLYGLDEETARALAVQIEHHAADTLYDRETAISYEISEALSAIV